MTTELREERKAEQRQAPADTWPERKDPPAPEPSENEETPRRLWLWLLLGGLVFAGAAVAIWFLFYAGRENTDDAQVDGHLVWVAPKVAGHIAEVLVDDNQHVKAGQVLVRIDPRDYEVRVQRARADVLKAQSAVSGASAVVPLTRETTTSGTSSAAAQVASAEAEVIRAQAGLEQASGAELAFARANVRSKQAASERAQADLNRMRPLIAKAEISAQQFDAYVAAAKVAESELQAARERQGSAEKQVDIQRAAVQAAQTRVQQAQAGLEQSRAGQGEVAVRRADVLTAQAEVARAQAALAAAELDLSYTEIKAATDGVVTRKNAEPGQTVQVGQTLMTIVPLSDVWVTANFKETQLAKVHPGMRAEIEVDMYGGRKLAGKVDSIAGATGSRMSLLPPENATGNFVKVVQRIPVKIVLDRLPDGVTLRPGMNVDATIFTK